MSDIKFHRDHLSPDGQRHYIYDSDIQDSHPTRCDDPIVYDVYDAATILVGERHEKYDLVNLVGHLLLKLAQAERGKS